MPITEKIIYVSSDGKEFKDLVKAHRYENKEKISKIFFHSEDAIEALMFNWEELKELMDPPK